MIGKRLSRTAVAAVVLVAAGSIAVAGLFGGKKDKADPGAGDLAVIDLRVHEIRTDGGVPRVVVQALVENQKAVPRAGAFELIVRVKDAKEALGTCEGDGLPPGQVALCEIWLPNASMRQGEVYEAVLNRQVGDFNRWDTDPSDDRRLYEVRTVTEGGQTLRLAGFEVVPQTIQGAAEVQFRFQVEGAHLVWLLAEDRAPRLLAGHPADGLLQGKGRERISSTWPVTLVARNSFGAFVYETIPVLNVYQQGTPAWAREKKPEPEASATIRILDPGVYDIDEDQVILDKLRSYLNSKDWTASLDRIRAGEGAARARRDSALNPKARDRDRQDEETPAAPEH